MSQFKCGSGAWNKAPVKAAFALWLVDSSELVFGC